MHAASVLFLFLTFLSSGVSLQIDTCGDLKSAYTGSNCCGAPRETPVTSVSKMSAVTHGHESSEFWQLWGRGFETMGRMCSRASVQYSGYNVSMHTTLIRDRCNDSDAVAITVPWRRETSEGTLVHNEIEDCLDKGVRVFTTNTDTYNNSRVYGYIGPTNYQLGKLCSRLALNPHDHDSLHGRGAHSPLEFRAKNLAFAAFISPSEVSNEAIQSRLRGFLHEMSEHNLSVPVFTNASTGSYDDQIRGLNISGMDTGKAIIIVAFGSQATKEVMMGQGIHPFHAFPHPQAGTEGFYPILLENETICNELDRFRDLPIQAINCGDDVIKKIDLPDYESVKIPFYGQHVYMQGGDAASTMCISLLPDWSNHSIRGNAAVHQDAKSCLACDLGRCELTHTNADISHHYQGGRRNGAGTPCSNSRRRSNGFSDCTYL